MSDFDNDNDNDFDDLYDEKELRVEEQDLRLIKSIVTDQEIARNFAKSNDSKLFIGDAFNFAKQAIDYYKTYDSLPTRRVMLDAVKNEPDLSDTTNQIWDHLDDLTFDKSEFNFDLTKIKQRYSYQKVASIKRAIEAESDLDEILLNIKRDLDDVERVKKGNRKSAFIQKTIRNHIPDFKSNYIEKTKNPEKGQGILTHYSFLDYITNGLEPSDMLVIAAESGGGKSMLLSNMAIQMWMQLNTIESATYSKGYNVQYFSLEMPFEQCFRRSFARIGDLPTYGLRDAKITKPAMLQRMSQAAKFIHRYPSEFEIIDIPRGVTVEDIEDRYLDALSRGIKHDIIVVDYLGLMHSSNTEGDDWLRLGNIASQLHEFARTYDLVVLTAVQLNRASSRKPEDVIGMHRIGRSSQIIHHASIGIQIETRHDEVSMPDLKYHVIKNRNGEHGSHILEKRYRNATIVDFKDKYTPRIDTSSSFVAINPALEDISGILEGYGWPI